MAEQNGQRTVIELSDQMADAVERAARSTVLVNGRQRFPASGIAIASDLILTADHVVERDEDLSIMTGDGVEAAAQLLGRDAATDIAVLRAANVSLEPAAEASSPARVGQMVLAVGRPTSSGPMASLGIVSAILGPWRSGRGGMIERILRTDAIPYPGFSGGPLIGIDGTVVGMTTTGMARGPALAIPSAIAWRIAQTLAQHGQLKRGYLGISSQPVKLPEHTPPVGGVQPKVGLLLVHVEPGSPAAQAGLLLGDILIALDGQIIEDVDDLQALLVGDKVGQSVPLHIIRGGELREIQVTIGARG
jgi:S1-C subfamily serine protease